MMKFFDEYDFITARKTETASSYGYQTKPGQFLKSYPTALLINLCYGYCVDIVILLSYRLYKEQYVYNLGKQ